MNATILAFDKTTLRLFPPLPICSKRKIAWIELIILESRFEARDIRFIEIVRGIGKKIS